MSAAAETGLFLDGLRCAGCVHSVERGLQAAPGVLEATANYTTHRALVRFSPNETDPSALVRVVEALGFEATPYDPAALDRPAQSAQRSALVRLLVAAFLAANVMMVAIALYIGAFEGQAPEVRRGLRWLAIALSLPAVTWCAAPFWRGAWRGLQQRRLTIDVPIVLGFGTAFATNIAGTIAETHHLYVDSAAMIVFLILLGRTLERRARGRASAAVDRLTALTPATALVIEADGTLRSVEAAGLQPGDRVRVAPGETIPADGRIVRGSSEFDESLLTGESMPVLRECGTEVTGGTLNANAEVDVEILASPSAGTLARLAAVLERAQAERPQIQRLADRIASVFAPTVVVLAAATAIAWTLAGSGAFEAALAASAVLIVACPCALGLATPVAITVAVGRAASLGILVKSGEALERCAAVDKALLDKTGTITPGNVAVTAVEAAEGFGPDEVLQLAALAEGASTHPVARAITRTATAKGRAASLAGVTEGDRSNRPGRGVAYECAERRILVGSAGFLESEGVSIPEALGDAGRALAEEGQSLAWVASEGAAAGVIALIDPPRDDAREGIARLRALGVEPELLTGDHRAAAERVAALAGIDRQRAGVSPEDKLAAVRREQEGGARVLAVGDGINDAALLAAADVGCAMSCGADVTLHAADVVVRAPRVTAIPELVELARATFGRIRENLGFALLYNALAIPLAATGRLDPLWAAVAMSASSLAVIGNAARLQAWKART